MGGVGGRGWVVLGVEGNNLYELKHTNKTVLK